MCSFWSRASSPKAPAAKAGPVFTCKGKGVQATGYEASQGFVVQAGSQAVVDSGPPARQQPWCWPQRHRAH